MDSPKYILLKQSVGSATPLTLKLYISYSHRCRNQGCYSTPTFQKLAWNLCQKFLAAIKARYYKVCKSISMARKRCTLSTTHAIILLICQSASYLIILCRFQHPHFQVGFYASWLSCIYVHAGSCSYAAVSGQTHWTMLFKDQ